MKAYKKRHSLLLGTAFLSLLLLACIGGWRADAKNLVILTTNDYHGQLDPIITREGAEATELGGIARLTHAITTIKQQYPGSVLALNAGDSFTGKYFLQFQGKATFAGLSLAGIDVATLGNHEFDRGPDILARALPYCSFPTVSSNLRLSGNSPLRGTFREYVVLERNGLAVGVLGLMTPNLNRISRAGDSVSAEPDLAGCARTAITKMSKDKRPDVIVALTHIGLDADRRLARDVPEIDVICGGHSHDYLGKGEEIVVSHPDGRKTIIVQAGSRGRHLGVVTLNVVNASVASHTWSPLRLDEKVPKDTSAEAFLEKYRRRLPAPKPLTTITRPIDCRSATVRAQESEAGNLICDIMRKEFKTDIALHNGGGIRGDRVIPAGVITSDDVETMLPFGNSVCIVSLTGKKIEELFEQSAKRLPRLSGGFLHVSGLRLTINLNNRRKAGQDGGQGKLVEHIVFVDHDGTVKPLEPNRSYSAAVNSYLAGGGDAYSTLKGSTPPTDTGIVLHTAISSWLSKQTVVRPVIDGRITVLF